MRQAGRVWTVEEWLTYWVENIAARAVRENTLSGYRVAVNVHLIPGVGAHRLDRLEPEHLERLYSEDDPLGQRPATAHQAHRTVRTALGEAERRGRITRNPATLAEGAAAGRDRGGAVHGRRGPASSSKRQGSAATAHGGRSRSRSGFGRVRRWACAGRTSISTPARSGSAGAAASALRPWLRRDRVARRRATALSGSSPEQRPTTPSHAPDVARWGCLPSWARCSSDIARNKTGSGSDAGQLWRDSGYVFATPVGEPINPNGLPPLEAAACGCRFAGWTPARCPAHGRHRAAHSWRS